MKRLRALARVVPLVAVVLVLVGLGAAPAAAGPAPAAVPAAAPAVLPTVDWLGITKCATWLIPNMPKAPDGPVECVKVAVKGAKDGTTAAAKKLGETVIGDAASSMAEFSRDLIKIGFTFWLSTDSVQVKESGVLGDPNKPDDPTRSISLHALMVGIGAGIATLLAMGQGIKMIMQRSGAPLGQLLQGLFMNVIVSAAGVGVIDALLVASDQLTRAILQVGFGDDDVPDRMALILLPSIGNPMGLLVIALIVLIIGGIQLVMLFLRQAAIPIQALLLPIAGAGQLGGESARQWLPRLFTAIMVIITYKPMAALIISVGFIEMKHGQGIIDFIRGVVTLALSIIALKSLLALFAPLGLAMGNAVASGGASGALSMAGSAMASTMGGAGGGGGDSAGSSAVSHAADMDRNGPAGGGNSGSGSGGPGGGDNGGDDSSSSAIQQASGNIPQQAGTGSAAGEGVAAAAEGTASTGTAVAGQATAAGGTGSMAAAGAGPVGIAVVAAEAGKAAVDKAGGAVGGKE
ncbi:hypothetical protein [Streptomyces jumonjinensis]|uniref:Type IV secretion system protein n=1 Tax=Streptomyces jumonjinensis TaxID=1945 RepID=A0A646KKT6_STRJU|nr:hypothetical protein [Streptomyces jumonjinensis]MQT02912.1 hypothetical protein [Streptomyces jumonjinensis]